MDKKKGLAKLLAIVFACLAISSAVILVPDYAKGSIAQAELDAAVAEGVKVQTGIYLSARDMESAKYPLRNIYLFDVGVDPMEMIDHPVFGRGWFCINDKGQFMPIFCYRNGKCIMLGKDPEVIDMIGVCQR